MQNITPLGNRVILKRAEEETTSSGGIILPDNSHERQDHGIVTAIGPKCKDVRVGDKILFNRWTAKEIDLKEQICWIEESEIVGVFR